MQMELDGQKIRDSLKQVQLSEYHLMEPEGQELLAHYPQLPSYEQMASASENDVRKFKRELEKNLVKEKRRMIGKHDQLASEFANREHNRRVKCAYKVGNTKKKTTELTSQERRMHDILYKDRFDHKVSKQNLYDRSYKVVHRKRTSD